MANGTGILNKLANLMGLDRPAGEVQRLGSMVGEPDALSDISTVNRVYDYYRKYTHLNPDRLSLYDDYDEMDQMTLLASALDLYAEDATQTDHDKGVSLWIESENEEVKTELDRMLDRIQIEDDITAIARGIAKYGDDFEATMYNEEHGVFGLTFLEPKIVWKHEDKNRVLTGWSVGAAKKVDEKPQFQAWDIVHGLRKGRRRNEMYGDSILLPARLVYKILKLMEEQMVIYRLSMHPDRLIFYVDVGAAAPDEARTILDNWRKAMQKKQFFNPKTGQYQEEYNPWALDNNIYWATRPNSESKIEKFQGSCFTGDTKVSLLDGTEVPIKDLVDREEFWVYSTTRDGHIVTGRGHSARLTKKKTELIEVELDNGEKIRCTPDHRFMLRDGTYCEAQSLKPSNRLMPLYRRQGQRIWQRYEEIYNPATNSWHLTHHLTAPACPPEVREKARLQDCGCVRHHRDFNSRNNSPDNLEWATWRDHQEFHQKHLQRSIHSPEAKKNAVAAIRKLYADPDWRARKVAQQAKTMKKINDEHKDRFNEHRSRTGKVTGPANLIRYNKSDAHRKKSSEIGRKYGFGNPETVAKVWTEENRAAQGKRARAYNLAHRDEKSQLMKDINAWRRVGKPGTFKEFRAAVLNHKVVSVRFLEDTEDVYDISVDDYHNFALTSGVFVHNSNVGEIFDVEYFRDLIFSAIRVPKAFLGFEGDINAKATLSQQDIRFSRSVKGVQRSVRMLVHRAGQIHLGLRQRNPRDRKHFFKTKMTPVSYLDEAQRSDLYQLRFELVDRMSRLSADFEDTLDKTKWLAYILVDIAGFSKELVAKLITDGGDEFQGDDDPTPTEKRAIGVAIKSSPAAHKLIDQLTELAREERNMPRQEVPGEGFKEEHQGISSLPETRKAEEAAEKLSEKRRVEREKDRSEAFATTV